MKKLIILCAALALSACSTKGTSSEPAEPKGGVATAGATDSKAAGTAAKGATTAAKADCKLDKDTRIIEVRKTDSGGCELFYTKFGEEKSVASSGFGTQYCEEVKDRIESNLSKAGFTCQ